MSFSQYNRLNVHVAASNVDVVRKASTRLKKASRFNREQRDARHEFYRAMIAQHSKAKKLFNHFRF